MLAACPLAHRCGDAAGDPGDRRRAVAGGAGLGHLGALKSPWVLQPVFAGFSILSPSWLWLEIPAMLVVVGAFTWAASGRRMLRVRRVPAWRSATIGVEGADSYTAFGYANPTRRVLASVLHTRAELRPVAPDDGDDDADVEFISSAPEASVCRLALTWPPASETTFACAWVSGIGRDLLAGGGKLFARCGYLFRRFRDGLQQAS